jgi:hypothetical protein
LTSYVGTKSPGKNKENNWVQTISGKDWNTLLRLYGLLGPSFDKTWWPRTGSCDHTFLPV